FQKTLIVSDYYLNTAAYIAQCINKEKPQMHCNGKCQLENKLEETDENDSQKPVKNNNQLHEVILFLDDLELFNYLNLETRNKSFFRPQTAKTKERPHSIFRPPIV